MPANINNIEKFDQKKIQESRDVEYPLVELVDQCDSEITWIQLHQMFDK
tara:strand:+ start:422 stop:568 length:147 start_codon:yes stop_codon:yes gene_type:complete